jgi:hypothetical protein
MEKLACSCLVWVKNFDFRACSGRIDRAPDGHVEACARGQPVECGSVVRCGIVT